jgi:hypothetical protein
MDFNIDKQVLNWLIAGDVSIQFQVHRDLLKEEQPSLQNRIAKEGWGAKFLSFRLPNGHWGRSFYQPKWTSTHYTLLDLRNLCVSPKCTVVKDTLRLIVNNEKGPDGGVNPSRTLRNSDVCVNGMALNYLSYFQINEPDLISIIDFLITQHMPDGGFNCYSNRKGATHSSLHTTLSVLEGIFQYAANGYRYRLDELQQASKRSEEFILEHRLFRSHKTGEIIDPKMLQLSYPSRWRYDILRALDYFQVAGARYDNRMDDALEILLKKRGADKRWKLQARHAGMFHFEMEKAAQPSRWNTLRALRVLRHFNVPF